jgi:hypothetical protein
VLGVEQQGQALLLPRHRLDLLEVEPELEEGMWVEEEWMQWLSIREWESGDLMGLHRLLLS